MGSNLCCWKKSSVTGSDFAGPSCNQVNFQPISVPGEEAVICESPDVRPSPLSMKSDPDSGSSQQGSLILDTIDPSTNIQCDEDKESVGSSTSIPGLVSSSSLSSLDLSLALEESETEHEITVDEAAEEMEEGDEDMAIRVDLLSGDLMMRVVVSVFYGSMVGAHQMDDIMTRLYEYYQESEDTTHEAAPPLGSPQIEALERREIKEEEISRFSRCPICLESFTGGVEVTLLACPCSHPGHTVCLTHWLRMKGSCPVCRDRLTSVRDTQE